MAAHDWHLVGKVVDLVDDLPVLSSALQLAKLLIKQLLCRGEGHQHLHELDETTAPPLQQSFPAAGQQRLQSSLLGREEVIFGQQVLTYHCAFICILSLEVVSLPCRNVFGLEFPVARLEELIGREEADCVVVVEINALLSRSRNKQPKHLIRAVLGVAAEAPHH